MRSQKVSRQSFLYLKNKYIMRLFSTISTKLAHLVNDVTFDSLQRTVAVEFNHGAIVGRSDIFYLLGRGRPAVSRSIPIAITWVPASFNSFAAGSVSWASMLDASSVTRMTTSCADRLAP